MRGQGKPATFLLRSNGSANWKPKSSIEKVVEEEKNGDYIVTTYRHIVTKKPHNDDGPAKIFEEKSGRFQKTTYQWLLNGKFHRDDDLPAIDQENINVDTKKVTSFLKKWYQDGVLQREDDKPALISLNNGVERREWYKNGQAHRIGKPAVEEDNGIEIWYKEDEPHREDGPAWVVKNKKEDWYFEGHLHRMDGPAWNDLKTGKKKWAYYGEVFDSEEAWKNHIHSLEKVGP